ncbi:MAG: DMT family transporter [Armatimonadota bacterium]
MMSCVREPNARPDQSQVQTGDVSEMRAGAAFDPVLALVALIWGANFVAYKYLMEFIPARGLLAARFGAITVVLLVVLAWRGQLVRGNSPAMWLRLFLAGVLVMGTQQISFVSGLDFTAAGEGSLLFSTAPIFTALIAAAIGQEAIARANWAGIAAAMLGAALVILGGANARAAPQTRVLGDLLMLVSSLGYAGFMVLSRPLGQRYGALKIVAFAYLFGTLVVMPFGGREMLQADWGALGWREWFAMCWLVLLAGAFGFVAWYWRIAHTTSARVAVYQYLVPVVAMITAAILLGERPTAVQLGGAALVLTGLYFARRREAVACPS